MGPKKVKSGNGSESKKPKRITVKIKKVMISKHEKRHHIPPPLSTYASNYVSTAKGVNRILVETHTMVHAYKLLDAHLKRPAPGTHTVP